MTARQWPATILGTAWMTYDPDDGWTEHDNPSDAERTFGAIVDHLRDEASEAWHESADTAAWGIWIPIERLRLVATAWPEDETEDGERCRDAGWDALLDGVVERVEADSAALDFCGRRAASTIAARDERDAALAEVERLREALTEARRPPEDAARERIRRFLEREIDRDDYPLSLISDGDSEAEPGKCGWAFWLLEGDPTSYVHEDLTIEWYGTSWGVSDV